MATLAPDKLAQCMLALQTANDVRMEKAAVKREIASGKLSFADALVDARTQRMELGVLLLAQHQWGRVRMCKLLCSMRFPVSEYRRVGDLTEHQRSSLVERVEGR